MQRLRMSWSLRSNDIRSRRHGRRDARSVASLPLHAGEVTVLPCLVEKIFKLSAMFLTTEHDGLAVRCYCAARRSTASRTERQAVLQEMPNPTARRVWVSPCAGARAPAVLDDRVRAAATATDAAHARRGRGQTGGRECGWTAESRQGKTAR